MTQTVTVSQMTDQLLADSYSGYTFHGAKALAEWLDENEHELANFNVNEIRGYWTQHENLVAFAEMQYGEDWKFNLGLDMHSEKVCDDVIRDSIIEASYLIEFEDGIIVKDF